MLTHGEDGKAAGAGSLAPPNGAAAASAAAPVLGNSPHARPFIPTLNLGPAQQLPSLQPPAPLLIPASSAAPIDSVALVISSDDGKDAAGKDHVPPLPSAANFAAASKRRSSMDMAQQSQSAPIGIVSPPAGIVGAMNGADGAGLRPSSAPSQVRARRASVADVAEPRKQILSVPRSARTPGPGAAAASTDPLAGMPKFDLNAPMGAMGGLPSPSPNGNTPRTGSAVSYLTRRASRRVKPGQRFDYQTSSLEPIDIFATFINLHISDCMRYIAAAMMNGADSKTSQLDAKSEQFTQIMAEFRARIDAANAHAALDQTEGIPQRRISGDGDSKVDALLSSPKPMSFESLVDALISGALAADLAETSDATIPITAKLFSDIKQLEILKAFDSAKAQFLHYSQTWVNAIYGRLLHNPASDQSDQMRHALMAVALPLTFKFYDHFFNKLNTKIISYNKLMSNEPAHQAKPIPYTAADVSTIPANAAEQQALMLPLLKLIESNVVVVHSIIQPAKFELLSSAGRVPTAAVALKRFIEAQSVKQHDSTPQRKITGEELTFVTEIAKLPHVDAAQVDAKSAAAAAAARAEDGAVGIDLVGDLKVAVAANGDRAVVLPQPAPRNDEEAVDRAQADILRQRKWRLFVGGLVVFGLTAIGVATTILTDIFFTGGLTSLLLCHLAASIGGMMVCPELRYDFRWPETPNMQIFKRVLLGSATLLFLTGIVLINMFPVVGQIASLVFSLAFTSIFTTFATAFLQEMAGLINGSPQDNQVKPFVAPPVRPGAAVAGALSRQEAASRQPIARMVASAALEVPAAGDDRKLSLSAASATLTISSGGRGSDASLGSKNGSISMQPPAPASFDDTQPGLQQRPSDAAAAPGTTPSRRAVCAPTLEY